MTTESNSKTDIVCKAPCKNFRDLTCFDSYPSRKHLIGTRFILQNDNDPKHTAKNLKRISAGPRRPGSPPAEGVAPAEP